MCLDLHSAKHCSVFSALVRAQSSNSFQPSCQVEVRYTSWLLDYARTLREKVLNSQTRAMNSTRTNADNFYSRVQRRVSSQAFSQDICCVFGCAPAMRHCLDSRIGPIIERLTRSRHCSSLTHSMWRCCGLALVDTGGVFAPNRSAAHEINAMRSAKVQHCLSSSLSTSTPARPFDLLSSRTLGLRNNQTFSTPIARTLMSLDHYNATTNSTSLPSDFRGRR